MQLRKKKSYIVTLQVNLCAEHEVKVPVRATKKSLACRQAEKALLESGYFQAKAIDCKEVIE